MLELADVHTYYGQSYVLQGLSLRVAPGTVVGMLGRNGMGKTTAMRSIMGLTPARRGIITFRGLDVTRLDPSRIARQGIGYVPQGRRIFPSLTVNENLLVAARGDEGRTDWNLSRIHEIFPVLQARAKQMGGLLSGGEQQMLAISRALMTNPKLLLLDEPSEGLSPTLVQRVGDIVTELREHGLSILLVEQNVHMALRVSDYVYVITKGRIALEALGPELRENAESLNEHVGVT